MRFTFGESNFYNNKIKSWRPGDCLFTKWQTLSKVCSIDGFLLKTFGISISQKNFFILFYSQGLTNLSLTIVPYYILLKKYATFLLYPVTVCCVRMRLTLSVLQLKILYKLFAGGKFVSINCKNCVGFWYIWVWQL